MTRAGILSLLDPRVSARHIGWWAVFYAILSGAAVAALFFDSRVLPSGDPVALKPLKFALSFTIHCATLWLLAVWSSRAEATDSWFAVSVWVTIAALIAEAGAVFTQGVRGVPSHFNYASTFDRTVFTIMGIGTIGLVLAALLTVIGLVRRPGSAAPMVRLSIVIGILVMLLGSSTGVVMVMPTSEQAAALAQGVRPAVIGTHSTGAGTGPGLPLFGWSLVSGDWRVPHFIGIHGFQTIPLFAWMVLFLPAADWVQWKTFLAASGLYIALFGWALLRTIEGKSVFLLDDASIAVGGAFLAAALITIALAFRGLQIRREVAQ